jgi:hypothetical protein
MVWQWSAAMSPQGATKGLLIRSFGPHKSLIFTLTLHVERDKDTGLFDGTVVGLEDSIAGIASTRDDALMRAVRLFQSVVDDAIHRHMSLRELLSDERIKVLQSELPIDDVVRRLNQGGDDSEDEQDSDWRSVRSPIFSIVQMDL